MKKHLLKHFCAVFLAGFMALLLLPQAAQAQSKEAYVVKSRDKKTLTFYYDTKKSSRTGSNVWGIEEKKKGENFPAWSGTYSTSESEVSTAVFDASFKNYRPQSTEKWFFNFVNLKKIDGLANLNTSEVTNMASMFWYCEKLSKLDLSNFDTKKVEEMKYMFQGCEDLQTIYCNDTWTCAESEGMFSGCEKLKGAVPYNENKVDVSMANPNTGYFTKKKISGVTTITNNNANIQAIYSTDGKRLNELQRGLNIVRMSNGTTQKILRK